MTPHCSCRVWPNFAAAALLAAGCSTSTYRMKVDAIAKPNFAEAQSFKLKSKDPRIGEESIRYKEVAGFVKTALAGKGLFEAPNEATADMIVELDYGIDAPRTRVERVSVPVYRQGGSGPYGLIRSRQRSSPVGVGCDEVLQPVTTYEKHLWLTARENKPASESKATAELWSLQADVDDESSDLRKYLPLMASASLEYVGRDTGGQKAVKVRDPSPAVEFIKRGRLDTNFPVAARFAPAPEI